MNLKHGVFTVSLDFEMYWGVRDKWSTEEYKYNLKGVRKAVPKMLRMFSDNGIHATWATIGFLFFKSTDELKENLTNSLPKYEKENHSPYKYIEKFNDLDPVYHFAPELIALIQEFDGQEIGTHTFSHYYCLEEGQTIDNFYDDIYSAVKVAESHGISIKSLVFPKNQWKPEYLSVLSKLGIRCYRGNEASWIYHASSEKSANRLFQKALRLIDSYINISGHNVYDLYDCTKERPFNFPSSRILRPYSKKLAILDRFKLNRIKRSMTYAAKNKKIFHLWWHPHNFGVNTSQNINFLYEIIEHYNDLKENLGMVSLNMGELSEVGYGK